MNCCYCGAEDLQVIETRPYPTYVRRRRACAACGGRFTTRERVDSATVGGLRPLLGEALRGLEAVADRLLAEALGHTPSESPTAPGGAREATGG